MSDLTKALNRILNWLEQYDPKAASSLQPGLTDTEIQEMVKHLPFELPEEIYELYQWRNGSQPEQLFLIFHGMELLSLQNALKFYEVMKQSEPLFFPFIHSIPNLKCGKIVINEGIKNSQIIFSDIKEYGLIKLGYINLTSMMQTIAECYENQIYNNLMYDEELNDFKF